MKHPKLNNMHHLNNTYNEFIELGGGGKAYI